MSFIGAPKCTACAKPVYPMERMDADGKPFHKTCMKCAHCQCTLKLGNFAAMQGVYYCKPHFKQLFKLKGNYDSGFGREQAKMKWDAKQGLGYGAPESTAVVAQVSQEEPPVLPSVAAKEELPPPSAFGPRSKSVRVPRTKPAEPANPTKKPSPVVAATESTTASSLFDDLSSKGKEDTGEDLFADLPTNIVTPSKVAVEKRVNETSSETSLFASIGESEEEKKKLAKEKAELETLKQSLAEEKRRIENERRSLEDEKNKANEEINRKREEIEKQKLRLYETHKKMAEEKKQLETEKEAFERERQTVLAELQQEREKNNLNKSQRAQEEDDKHKQANAAVVIQQQQLEEERKQFEAEKRKAVAELAKQRSLLEEERNDLDNGIKLLFAQLGDKIKELEQTIDYLSSN
jgi:hypothetical protein